jgi:hypothetical protein
VVGSPVNGKVLPVGAEKALQRMVCNGLKQDAAAIEHSGGMEFARLIVCGYYT